ncbi:MAG TPA: hypothetical protein VJL80_09990 [Aeromicrobium sp.]|nr:hypothetical protein [Aeromicrobium sp.]HKY58357.1 hypothetical protein [Aeromicrobium sp.]
MSEASVFRRSDGLVVHVRITGYEPGRKRRSPALRDHQALCGASAWKHRNGSPVDVDLPVVKPLRWCGRCIGLLSVERGRVDSYAAELLEER